LGGRHNKPSVRAKIAPLNSGSAALEQCFPRFSARNLSQPTRPRNEEKMRQIMMAAPKTNSELRTTPPPLITQGCVALVMQPILFYRLAFPALHILRQIPSFPPTSIFGMGDLPPSARGLEGLPSLLGRQLLQESLGKVAGSPGRPTSSDLSLYNGPVSQHDKYTLVSGCCFEGRPSVTGLHRKLVKPLLEIPCVAFLIIIWLSI